MRETHEAKGQISSCPVATPNLTTPLAGPDGEAVLDGDDTQVGYSLGSMISFSPQAKLGITYQSGLEPSYSGDVTLSPRDAQVGVDAEIPLAALLRVGMTHAFNDRWQGHVTVGWEDWDTLDALILSTETAGVVAERNWDDTYHYATGVTHKLDERWTVQAGLSYDTNPADKEFRTADLPIDRQVRSAVGARHVRPRGLEIVGHLVYTDYCSTKIDSRGFEQTLEDLFPQVPLYTSLQNALAKYRVLAEQGGWPTVPTGPTIKSGATDARRPGQIHLSQRALCVSSRYALQSAVRQSQARLQPWLHSRRATNGTRSTAVGR